MRLAWLKKLFGKKEEKKVRRASENGSEQSIPISLKDNLIQTHKNQIHDLPFDEDVFFAKLEDFMMHVSERDNKYLYQVVEAPHFDFRHRRLELFYWRFVRYLYQHPGYKAVFDELVYLLDRKGDIPSVVVKYFDSESSLFQKNGVIEKLRKIPLYLHTVHVAEIGAEMFRKYTPFNYKLYLARWLITALGHDIGKIKCYEEKEAGKRKIEHTEYSTQILEELFATASCIAPGVKNQIIQAVYYHHDTKNVWELDKHPDKVFAIFLKKADAQARQEEMKLTPIVEAVNPMEEVTAPEETEETKEAKPKASKPKKAQKARAEAPSQEPAPKVEEEPPQELPQESEEDDQPVACPQEPEPQKLYTDPAQALLMEILKKYLEKGEFNNFQPLLRKRAEKRGFYNLARNLIVFDEKSDSIYVGEQVIAKEVKQLYNTYKLSRKTLIESLKKQKIADFKPFEIVLPPEDGDKEEVGVKVKMLHVKDREFIRDALGYKKFSIPRNLLTILQF